MTSLSKKYYVPLDVLAAGGAGLLLGGAVLWLPPLHAIGVFAGVISIFALSKRPEIGLLGIIFATSTIIAEENMLRVSFGIGYLYLTDVILFLLLGLIFSRLLTSPNQKLIRTPLD